MENNNSFNYFAYASNLKKSTLEQKTGSKIQNFVQGRLLDYGFRFNFKNTEGSARANIIVSESEDVFGAIYEIENKYKEGLLSTEPGYRIINVTIETETVNVPALTFISDQDDENIYPSKDYLKSITEGAKEHKLPQEYLEFVVSMSK
ncbi:MAG: gamma-glutamylcyclotransferase [Bacteroidetes bacterium]|uniref:gamma-glutamylcyclotransferase n=1 Tax=Daejeonella sp. TaxID=2805397 RepID=UPI0040496381|nr:gamma-glutamylcyclotransferase [Bacteroidota bacterium]